MKTLLLGAALLGLLTVPADADTDTKYDRKLEQAAIDIVAGKIGGIRGGFAFDVHPVLVIVHDQMSTGSVPPRNASALSSDALRDSLAPAIERKATRIIF
jgi:hypothetical protein